MSEAAARRRSGQQRWAVPGSAHDRLVRWTKVVLPSAVGVLIAVLALAPLDRKGDVSFILDKKKVDIQGMFARLALKQGPLMIAANEGHYNLDTHQIAIDGAVRVAGPDGYRLITRDVNVNLKTGQLVSDGPVAGRMRLGTFEAGQLRADLGERKFVLNGGARLKIVQGAVR